MNTKNNSLYRETTQKFEEAIIELLEHHQLEKITVNMLCEQTGLHRTTFYAHFYNVYDLVEQMGTRVKGELLSQIYANNQNGMGAEQYRKLLEIIKENRTLYKLIRHSSYDIKAKLKESNSIELQLKRKSGDEVTAQYLMQFWSNGISAVIGKWIEQDCADDIEKVAQALFLCSTWL